MTTLRTPAPEGHGAVHSLEHPTPRDALDSGSVAELIEDSREVQLDIAGARPWPVRHHDIAVPSRAATLVEGLGTYGS